MAIWGDKATPEKAPAKPLEGEVFGPATQETAEEWQPKSHWRPTVAATLTFGFGLLMVAAVTAVLLISLGVAQRNTRDLNRDLADLLFSAVTEELREHVGSVETSVAQIADAIERGTLDPRDKDQLRQRLRWAMQSFPQTSALAFWDNDLQAIKLRRRPGGTIAIKQGDDSGAANVQSLMAKLRENPEAEWVGIQWVEDLNEPALIRIEPVTQSDGRVVGALSGLVSVAELSRFLEQISSKLQLKTAILFGEDEVLAHPELAGDIPALSAAQPLPSLDQLEDPHLASIWNEPLDVMADLVAGTDLVARIVEGPQEDLFFIYQDMAELRGTPIRIVMYDRLSAVNTEIERLWKAAAAGGGILLLSVLLAVFIGRSIARPAGRLAEAATAIQRLELQDTPRLPDSMFRELNHASRAYNTMANGLRWFELYLPRRLVLRLIENGDQAVRSAEREVTVLFTDIVGFTTLGGAMTPDALAAFLNHHFGLLGAAIESEEGSVDKYIGDSVMAVWGAPDEQTDHAERACRAALAMAHALEDDNRRREACGQPPVRIRIGIHSGTVVAGNIGAPGRVNYTLIGDTVNVAQRLEALGKSVESAPAGDRSAATSLILISQETAMRLPKSFRLHPLGSHVLRGRSAETEVIQLLGIDDEVQLDEARSALEQ